MNANYKSRQLMSCDLYDPIDQFISYTECSKNECVDLSLNCESHKHSTCNQSRISDEYVLALRSTASVNSSFIGKLISFIKRN